MIKTVFSRAILSFAILFSLTACKELDSVLEKVRPVLDQYQGKDSKNDALSRQDMIAAIKQALSQGVSESVSFLGSAQGFRANDLYHISLPEKLAKPADLLRKLGQGKQVDEFENRLNLAAETSVQQAIPVFSAAIQGMTVQDALGILRGGDDAATRYFRAKTDATLRQRFLPVIEQATSQTGLSRSYKTLVSKISSVWPGINEQAVNIDQYVLDHAMNALFDRVAIEEKQIRKNPAKRSTELMKTVFSRFAG